MPVSIMARFRRPSAAPTTNWNILTPVIAGQTITSSSLYGPNTARYDSSLAPGEIIAVGSYKYTDGASGPNADHGLLFQGTAEGVGTWTQIDANDLVGEGDTLINTIAHSNMNGLVVGNYDTDLAEGQAFLYNISANTWTNINPAGSASVTAYGIWHHGGDSSLYTIAGGYSDLNSGGLDEGYLVTYDLDTGVFSNFTSFNYMNQPIESVISHFDGITGVNGGFALTGDQLSVGNGVSGFYAFVPYVEGNYGPAVWKEISYPGADTTSGNTIVENNVLGVYVDGSGVKSFVAAVPEPGTTVLAFLGLGLLGATMALRGGRAKG